MVCFVIHYARFTSNIRKEQYLDTVNNVMHTTRELQKNLYILQKKNYARYILIVVNFCDYFILS